MSNSNSRKAYYTINAKTAAALRARALYAPELSAASRAAFAVVGAVLPAARPANSARRAYVRATNATNAQYTAAAIAARTATAHDAAAVNTAAALDTAGLTADERRMYAAHMARKHAAALAVGHAPAAVVRCLPSGAPSLLETSIKAARTALKVAARGGKVKKGASNNGNDKAREMLRNFARDVRAMLDAGLQGHVMSDAADFVGVAARALIECGAWDAAADAVDVARIVGIDAKGQDVTAFVYALRACHKHIYSNRAVRGRSARAVYLDAQEGNTDAIVCAAGLVENPIAQWEGQEHVSAMLRDIAAVEGEKRARIALRLYQGYTQEEIARELGISQQAVSKHIKHVRAALADILRA